MSELSMPEFPAGKVAKRIRDELKEFLLESGANGYVLGLSGGLDSSVAATLASQAIGRQHVTGLILPDLQVTPRADVKDAERLARHLGIGSHSADVSKVFSSFAKAASFYDEKARIANGNLRARIRMSLLYYYANAEGFLVLGTGDRSEILLGYFTKYGDGATDLLPLGDLYKTQVRELARFLKISDDIVSKPSSPRLWAGQTAQGELKMPYDLIDPVLYGFFDLKLSIKQIAHDLDISVTSVESLLERNRGSTHKRSLPSTLTVRSKEAIKASKYTL